MRRHDAHFTGLHLAQEARRSGIARADDHAFSSGGGARFTNAVGGQDCRASVQTIQPLRGDNFEIVNTLAGVYQRTPLVTLCRANGLPEPLTEYRFHPMRKYRFDYAYPVRLLAIEIEGGIWTQGRHTRGQGAIEDMRKYSAAALLGWRILYYQPSELSIAIADLRVEFGGQAA